MMASVFNFKKLRRFIRIYAAVQVFMIALLIYMAVFFQAGLRAEGRPQRFFHSVVVSLVIQLILFYPINRFAVREAEREVDACAEGLSFEQLKTFRSSRTIGDVIKSGVLLFFITFSYKAPQDQFVLSVIYFSCILTFLSYLQCFNFSAKRAMAGRS
jgi:hypothetical protein